MDMIREVFVSTKDQTESWMPKSLSVRMLRESGAQNALIIPATPSFMRHFQFLSSKENTCIALRAYSAHKTSVESGENSILSTLSMHRKMWVVSNELIDRTVNRVALNEATYSPDGEIIDIDPTYGKENWHDIIYRRGLIYEG